MTLNRSDDAVEQAAHQPGAGERDGEHPESAVRLSDHWSDSFLLEKRKHGDPEADHVISTLLDEHEVDEARRLLRTLIENDEPPPAEIPPVLIEYLHQSESKVSEELDKIGPGQDLFVEHGPLMLLCLGCYSLPAAYAANNGVRVLHRTAYLEQRPAKRLFETTQMVIDVMSPGGLGPKGRGIRAAQKVRLMHAMVRHLILNGKKLPWDTDLYGIPINQEDLAGTLMTFARIPIDGLHRLGVPPDPAAEESYLAAWRCIGRLMGVDEDLLPSSMPAAKRLTDSIHAQQVRPNEPNEAGVLMTRALLEMMERNGPWPLRHVPAALMRHFLPKAVANALGIRRFSFARLVVIVLSFFTAILSRIFRDGILLRWAARHFGTHLLDWLVSVETGGRAAPFDIPAHLKRHWKLSPETEPTFWDRFELWMRRLFGGRVRD